MAKLRIILILILCSPFIKAHQPGIIFKENKGQWPQKVLFGSEFKNTQFYINKNSFNYCIYKYSDLEKLHEYVHHRFEEPKESRNVSGHNYEVEFIGADFNSVIKSKEQPEYYNYFLGNNKSKWATSVKAFGNLFFKEIYEGVDLKVYSNGINLKYDFIVKPNANTSLIRLNYKYANEIAIVNNELVIRTSVGDIKEKEPFAYQVINNKQIKVECKYTLLSDNKIGFIFPYGYNKSYDLIIDPVVVVCSYSGSSAQSGAAACTYDDSGNIYSFGYAQMGYPTTTGAFQLSANAYYDLVLSVYNNTGSSKLFSTYVGGDSLELPSTIIVKNNEITLFGQTISTNFPCTSNAYDTVYDNNSDFVISKLNMSGTTLLASTYIGGSSNEGVDRIGSSNIDYNGYGEMVCDTAGNSYILSTTTSSNFPVTGSAISIVKQGISDLCIFKMNKTLTNLVWSTYLGGSRDETGKSLRLDGSGGLYLLGSTTSSNYPVTTGVIQPTKGGVSTSPTSDIFISHINSTGSALISSTYLGFSSSDYGLLLDIDENQDLYLFGHTSSPSLIIPTPGTYSNPNGFNTLHKINSTLTNVIYQTKFGNYFPGSFPGISPYLAPSAFKVDSCHNIYIAGHGENSFFTTPNAFQPLFGGGQHDLYFAVFSTNCASLKFASYWGGKNPHYGGWYDYGEHSDGGINHFDNKGNLYQSICINGALPTTSGGYSPTKSTDSTIWNEAFIKIDFQTFINAGSSYGANITGCPPFTPTFVSTTNTGSVYWDLGNGTTSIKDTISTTYTNLGTYNVLLIVTDTNTCNRYDSIKTILSVVNPPVFDIGDDVPTCIGVPALIKSNVTALTYSWSTGQTGPNILALPGTYTLTVNNGGCNSSDVVNVIVGEQKLSERFPNVVTPNEDGVNDLVEFKKYNFEEVEFILYDRWGKERFKTSSPAEEWRPKDLNDGTYFYVVNYKSSCTGKHAQNKGFITIFK